MRLLQKIFTTQSNKIVVAQYPNLPILLTIMFAISSFIAHQFSLTTTGEKFANISQLFLFVWAYLEITQGVNLFRRGLGFIVAAGVILSYLL